MAPTDAFGFDRTGARPHIQPALQRPATQDVFESFLQLCQAQALRVNGIGGRRRYDYRTALRGPRRNPSADALRGVTAQVKSPVRYEGKDSSAAARPEPASGTGPGA